MSKIPQFLTNYRIYNDGSVLLGVEADITLPNLEAQTETISGAGILGEFDSAIPGSFKSQSIEVGFRIIDKTMFTLAASTGNASLTFRGSQQINNYSKSGVVINQAVRIETRGPISGIDLGKASPGKATDSKLKQEVLFIGVYIDDDEVLYLDKINFVYRVSGDDMLSDILSNM